MKLKSVFAIAFAALLLFSACGETASTETGTEISSSAESEPFPGNTECRIPLYTGGETVYTLVRPDDASEKLVELFTTVTRFMKDAGIPLYYGEGDWVPAGTDTDARKELLLGYTARPESKTVLEELGADDYAVTTLNNKIVIAAHTEEKLREAVNVFCKELVEFETQDGKVSAVLCGTRVSRSGGKLAVRRNGGLEGYTVVYPAGNAAGKADAETLAASLKKAFGASLKVADDSAEKAGPEIVVGNANRDICRKIAAELPPDSNTVAENGGDIVLMGNTDTATGIAVKRMIAKYAGKGYSDTLAIGEGVNMIASNDYFADNPAPAEGADVRVMSFNLLAELWNDKPPIEGRDLAVMAVLNYFRPDVVGIQEVSDGWHKYLDMRLGEDYAFTDKKNNQGNTNFSTLLYNTKTLKLLKHGVKEYSAGNDLKLRLMTWAQFEVIATGKTFVAVSTHWDLGSNPEFQKLHSSEMAQYVQLLESKMKCPVVTTGDYNSNEKSANYTNFISQTGYKDAKFTAARVEKNCKTTHSLGAAFSTTTPGNAIDHIFGSNRVEFLYYNIVTDQTALNASDHCPIYADLRLD